MGPPAVCSPIRRRADQPAMLRAGHAVALCTLALLTLGVVMVTSAGLNVRPIGPAGVTEGYGPSSAGAMFASIALSRTGMYMALAVAAMWLASVMPLRGFAHAAARPVDDRRLALAIGVGVLAMLALLALVYLPGVGREVNGSSRWFELPLPGAGRLSVQPSEIVKWGMIALLAWYCVARADRLSRFRAGVLPGLAILGVLSAVVLIEDLGTGVLIASVGCLLMLAAGCRFTHFMLFAPLGLFAVGVAIWSSPYRLRRLVAFLDPYGDTTDTGYQMIQSLGAISGGGGFGRGLGHGIQKLGYLPEDQTDFVFAIICEELGIIGALLVAALFTSLLWFGLSIVRRERVAMLKLIGLGVLLTIGLQTIMNLFVVTGLGPTKGIALPLLSAGGTGWVLTAASLGLLVGMDRAHARQAGRVPDSLADQAREQEPRRRTAPIPEIVVTTRTRRTRAK